MSSAGCSRSWTRPVTTRRDLQPSGAGWCRLTILLEVHADAEEQLFYPRYAEEHEARR
jgi:hypothetical protein